MLIGMQVEIEMMIGGCTENETFKSPYSYER